MVSLTGWYCLMLTADLYNLFIEKYLNDDDKDNLECWYVKIRQQIDKLIKMEEALTKP